jgi:hypothetical protein
LKTRKNRVFSKSQKSVNYFWSDMKDAEIFLFFVTVTQE